MYYIANDTSNINILPVFYISAIISRKPDEEVDDKREYGSWEWSRE